MPAVVLRTTHYQDGLPAEGKQQKTFAERISLQF